MANETVIRVRVKYHNWKDKEKVYVVEGKEAQYVSKASDRLIVITDTGVHEDIIKTTILEKEYIL